MSLKINPKVEHRSTSVHFYKPYTVSVRGVRMYPIGYKK